MSKKANPAVVGAFVTGAIALLTVAVIVFGSGSLFKDKRKWVLYFDGSIKGLNPGSPVVFNGVSIGEVSRIRVVIDDDRNIQTPVEIELDPSNFGKTAEKISREESIANTREMIERGLRAQLQTQSLITGQLLIQLEFYPDKPARFVAKDSPLPEMPTIPSTTQQISKTLESLPLEEIVNNIHRITEGIDKFINTPELSNTLAEVNTTMKKAQSVLDRIDKQVDPIGTEAQKVLASAKTLLDTNDEKIASLLEDLEKTSVATREGIQCLTTNVQEVATKADEQITRFFETATTTSGYAEKMLSEQSEFRHELRQTLAELESALRAIRLFAEYMEQHPESLINGKAP